LVLVQVKLLDGYGLGALAIGGFDRAEIFAAAADNDDAPASQFIGFLGWDTLGHGSKIMAAEVNASQRGATFHPSSVGGTRAR
jgi:hypothetical protein